MTKAVLFDRDGTLIVDTPGNGDPAAIRTMPGAREALETLRDNGLRIGVITNQPAIAERRVSIAGMQAVHHRIEAELGRVDGWFICPHAADAGCGCRKPQPGLIFEATLAFGISPQECVVVGDIGSDMAAASNAGSRAVLVPTPFTRREEVARAARVCATLLDAAGAIVAELAAAR